MRREMELFFRGIAGLFSGVLDFTFNIVLFVLPRLTFLSPKGPVASFLSVVFARNLLQPRLLPFSWAQA